jgi:hypothetical protein
MIYTAATASNQFPTNPLFESKKIGNLAQVPLSRLHIVGKPSQAQFAYAGYKDNIEAFLYATYAKKKVIVGSGVVYPITEDINDLPLSSPASVAAFKKPPSQATKDKMMEAWAAYYPKFEVTKKKAQVNILFEGIPLDEWNRVKQVFEEGMSLDNRARPAAIT